MHFLTNRIPLWLIEQWVSLEFPDYSEDTSESKREADRQLKMYRQKVKQSLNKRPLVLQVNNQARSLPAPLVLINRLKDELPEERLVTLHQLHRSVRSISSFSPAHQIIQPLIIRDSNIASSNAINNHLMNNHGNRFLNDAIIKHDAVERPHVINEPKYALDESDDPYYLSFKGPAAANTDEEDKPQPLADSDEPSGRLVDEATPQEEHLPETQNKVFELLRETEKFQYKEQPTVEDDNAKQQESPETKKASADEYEVKVGNADVIKEDETVKQEPKDSSEENNSSKKEDNTNKEIVKENQSPEKEEAQAPAQQDDDEESDDKENQSTEDSESSEQEKDDKKPEQNDDEESDDESDEDEKEDESPEKEEAEESPVQDEDKKSLQSQKADEESDEHFFFKPIDLHKELDRIEKLVYSDFDDKKYSKGPETPESPEDDDDSSENDEEDESEEAEEEEGNAEELPEDAPKTEAAKESPKNRSLDEENDRVIKELISEHFVVDDIDGLSIPNGVKDTDEYKKIVEEVKKPEDLSRYTSFNEDDFNLDKYFDKKFQDRLKSLDEVKTEEEKENDSPKVEDGEKPAKNSEEEKKSDDSAQSPETQDTQTHEVIQPLLHTGGFDSGKVKVFDNSQQVVTVPFDYDYSSSQKSIVQEPSPKEEEATRTKRETSWHYEPERYDPHFSYDIPEPVTPDVRKYETKDYKDDELSPKAVVTENESGRKKTYIRVNQKEEKLYG
ncbi:uncharacterized protein LOC143192027 [Rhynchophorus ferrugineus]|uniref:uncharacterized protein LOC143192027 n=1 Tax=Rhynchophorus ferrugineus TaxID=354439 RepID=UPI003FCE5F77